MAVTGDLGQSGMEAPDIRRAGPDAARTGDLIPFGVQPALAERRVEIDQRPAEAGAGAFGVERRATSSVASASRLCGWPVTAR